MHCSDWKTTSTRENIHAEAWCIYYNGKSSVIWQRICGFFPPNYKRTEDLSDIDSVASSVHSTPPSSWWSEAQRCRQFPRCALCESHHTVGTEKRKNKHIWSTSRARTENLGWQFIRHLLIKPTETTDHNFYASISGLPEFWLNASFILIRAEQTRGFL